MMMRFCVRQIGIEKSFNKIYGWREGIKWDSEKDRGSNVINGLRGGIE